MTETSQGPGFLRHGVQLPNITICYSNQNYAEIKRITFSQKLKSDDMPQKHQKLQNQ